MRGTPTWDRKAPQMPVDEHGNFLHYPTYEHHAWHTISYPFHETMTIGALNQGRSAKWITLVGPDGRKYPLFVSDLVQGIKDKSLTIHDGELSGYWTGSKRGNNYGIKTVPQ